MCDDDEVVDVILSELMPIANQDRQLQILLKKIVSMYCSYVKQFYTWLMWNIAKYGFNLNIIILYIIISDYKQYKIFNSFRAFDLFTWGNARDLWRLKFYFSESEVWKILFYVYAYNTYNSSF